MDLQMLLISCLFICSYFFSFCQCKVFIKSVNRPNYYRYVSRVMYDGTRFKGFQDLTKSNNDTAYDKFKATNSKIPINTIQGILKAKLSERFNTKTSVIGASRTDTGVHAHGQAIHFDTEQPIENVQNFEFTMNRVLPDDIRLYNVSIAPLGTEEQIQQNELWHATRSTIGKYYSYTFCTNKCVDPMLRRYCGHVYFPIDIELLKSCLQLFHGTHDFSAFSNQVDRKRIEFHAKNMTFSTIKTIYSIQLTPLQKFTTNHHNNARSSSDGNSGYYRIDIYLNSALYRMVRNIVWACAYTAGGFMTYDELQALILRPVRNAIDNSTGMSYNSNRLPSSSSSSSLVLSNQLIIPKDDSNNKSDDNGNNDTNNDDDDDSSAQLLILPIRCRNTAKPAPAEGLCLERVLYDHY